jgi:hypothetical protein
VWQGIIGEIPDQSLIRSIIYFRKKTKKRTREKNMGERTKDGERWKDGRMGTGDDVKRRKVGRTFHTTYK